METLLNFLSENPEVAAAALSAVAAVAAAVAAFRAPIAAAAYSEQLRQAGTEIQQRRQVKLNVFAQIMQERADISQRECVIALNLIDVAFYDAPAVREAWAELYETFDLKNQVPVHVQNERLRKMLRAMASDLGLGENLRLDDFARTYYPNSLAREAQVRMLQQQDAIRRLSPQPQPEAPAPSADPVAPLGPPLEGWPPRPV